MAVKNDSWRFKMSFIGLASARYSCRAMNNTPVEKEKIENILNACTLAPTAINTQPFKV